MFRLTGSGAAVILGTILVCLLGSMIFAPRDTIRALREFWSFRIIRRAMRKPLGFFMVILTAITLLLTVASSIAWLMMSQDWLEFFLSAWALAITGLFLLMIVVGIISAVYDYFAPWPKRGGK